MKETPKTSLLIIASLFSAVGAAFLTAPENFYKGILCLFAATVVLIIRGILKNRWSRE